MALSLTLVIADAQEAALTKEYAASGDLEPFNDWIVRQALKPLEYIERVQQSVIEQTWTTAINQLPAEGKDEFQVLLDKYKEGK